MTCPVSDMGVCGVGEGAGVGESVGEGEGEVAVLLPLLHADAKVRSRTMQPGLSIGISAPEWAELRLNSYQISAERINDSDTEGAVIGVTSVPRIAESVPVHGRHLRS